METKLAQIYHFYPYILINKGEKLVNYSLIQTLLTKNLTPIRVPASATTVAQLCQRIGKVMPKHWQECANTLAKRCSY